MAKQQLGADELEAAADVCKLLDEIDSTLRRVDAEVVLDAAVMPADGSRPEDGLNGQFVRHEGGFWVYQPAGG